MGVQSNFYITLDNNITWAMYKIIILATFVLASVEDSFAGDLVEAAIESGKLNLIIKAATDAGLVGKFKAIPAATIFAPADQVFATLPEGFVDSLTIQNKTAILSRHTIVG